MSYSKVRRCDYCNELYEYKRKSSRFCKPTCRVSFNQYGTKHKSKLYAAIQSCYSTSADIRGNKSLATDDLMTDMIELKNALQTLENEYWSAMAGTVNSHGGQVHMQCTNCNHIFFGWKDDLENECIACGKEANWKQL